MRGTAFLLLAGILLSGGCATSRWHYQRNAAGQATIATAAWLDNDAEQLWVRVVLESPDRGTSFRSVALQDAAGANHTPGAVRNTSPYPIPATHGTRCALGGGTYRHGRWHRCRAGGKSGGLTIPLDLARRTTSFEAKFRRGDLAGGQIARPKLLVTVAAGTGAAAARTTIVIPMTAESLLPADAAAEIGRIVRGTDPQGRTAIPNVGSIPAAKALFAAQGETRPPHELVIFLAPQLVTPEN